ncbi:AI-2E family transporter [Devosia sp. ZB163]|uniref:AI-2E family transporter n=1 Tax=Devosia sp. ZB163 TaxID=3025938 RepID=UPI0023618A42|nr:AI-2E family transporter [Devosia sp. ZB163]MDC9826131.1 AI-2E family transporter [Devosia sp. ZB163]
MSSADNRSTSVTQETPKTMGLRNQVLIWVGLFLFAILLLWVFRSILLPFVVGLTLAYLLNPVVNWLQKMGIGRSWAAMLVLTGGIVLLVGLLLALVPLVAAQVGGLIAGLPGYVSALQELLREWAPQFTEWLGPERTAQLENSLADLIGRGVEFAGLVTATLAASGLTVINTIAVLFITPVVAFYLLVDWEGMMRKADDLLPRQHQAEIRGVLRDIDRAMAGVIRGQGGVILVLCVYYSTALTLSGLNYGLAIGLIGGLLSFVPYVGFFIGFALSMTVALVQFWPEQWVFVVIILAVYLVGQFLEANILYPKLVGQSININPVWLMFALFAFALLFGFVGLLLAVPLAAISGVLTRYALTKYQQSSLYLGEEAEPVEPAPEPQPQPAKARATARK